ncbi:MAG: hypothetical protein IPI67_35005 [Myxococcales bacterium]|nr:hypothetical protein [Myxococcales bacterium]
MRSHLIALITVPVLVVACGNQGIPNPIAADDATDSIDIAAAKSSQKTASISADDLPFIDKIPSAEETLPKSSPELAHKRVGDRSVHRFSGSYTKTPLILSQEVVARAGSLIVIDYTLEEGDAATRLRVTHDVGSDRVLRVREMRGKKELLSSAAAFEKMLAKTSFAPDDNEAEIGREKSTCLVAGAATACEKTAYRVKVGDKLATFSVSRGNDGSDLSGEISDESGSIIYKAELVETRTGLPAGVAAR